MSRLSAQPERGILSSTILTHTKNNRHPELSTPTVIVVDGYRYRGDTRQRVVSVISRRRGVRQRR